VCAQSEILAAEVSREAFRLRLSGFVAMAVALLVLSSGAKLEIGVLMGVYCNMPLVIGGPPEPPAPVEEEGEGEGEAGGLLEAGWGGEEAVVPPALGEDEGELLEEEEAEEEEGLE
jgi:hypothetical protein